ncbi:DUF1566 domain-containing protein [bacterium]|nr:DUF1566 domain-containing protein [bacterium]
MKKTTEKITIVLLIICISFLTACQGENDSCSQNGDNCVNQTEIDNNTNPDLVSLTFSIQLTKSLNPAKTYIAVSNSVSTKFDVVSVDITVRKTSDLSEIFRKIDLVEIPIDSGNWQGTLEDLPANTSFNFMANAYNESRQVIFTDSITQSLITDGTNELDFEMSGVNDSNSAIAPKIVAVYVPEEIETDSVGNIISIEIEYSDVVEYSIEVSNGSITSGISGIHDLVGNLEITYNAPSAPGEDTLVIRVKSADGGDTVSIICPLQIVETSVSGGISMVFGPIIEGLSILRLPDSLQIEVLTDSDAGLTYSWSGTVDFASISSSSSSNPLIINPFSESNTGDITIVVKGANGITTSRTQTMIAGDYPYQMIITEENESSPLPDTGQISSYTGIYGEDSDYGDNSKSFSFNSAETVTDNTTGLEWQAQDDNVERTWEGAVMYCQTLDLNNQSDWRLPEKKELIRLVNYGTYRPAIDTEFFTGTKSEVGNSYYWTATPYVSSSEEVWAVTFDWGFALNQDKGTSSYHYTRCVRGNQLATSEMVDNTDGTVTDNTTGLIWQQAEAGSLTWESAISYCEGLSLTGKDDWRLPNIVELESIIDDSIHSPAVNLALFPGVTSNGYWSSTTHAELTFHAMYSHFQVGNVGSFSKSETRGVHCVRNN